MRTLWRLAGYLRPHWKWVLTTYLGVTISTSLNLVIPWLIKQVIDVGLARGERRFILMPSGAILWIKGVSWSKAPVQHLSYAGGCTTGCTR